MIARFAWTPEAEQRLRDLAHTGISASQIAIRMGAPTKNTIIGKANRLGVKIGTPTRPAKPKIIAYPEKRRAAPKPIRTDTPNMNTRASVPVPKIISETPADAVRLMDIGHRQCRWSYGDPKTDTFRFCAADTDTERTFCAVHHRIAYVPLAVKRRDVA